MFKFINKLKDKKYTIKGFVNWLNYSLWNRAIFVYTSATLSIVVRYCFYSLHHDSWSLNFVTFYSAVFSYILATFFLFVFGVLKSVTFGEYIRRFVDIDRILENRLRAEKFRELVAETHNAHNSFKVYSRGPWLTFCVSFMLLSMTSGKSIAPHVSVCVVLYSLWILFNILYFAKCIHTTPIPEELKSVKPGWLIRWEDFNNRLDLMSGGSVVNESIAGSGLSKKFLSGVSKVATKSFNYVTDTKNTFTIIRCLAGVGTFIAGADYASAEASQRTSYVSRAFELDSNGTYSPDPDTRSKAAALRRRGIDLSDCCEPETMCLNPELVENKYEIARPYESRRYLALEEKAIALEEKAIALEEENRKLRLNLEGPCLE